MKATGPGHRINLLFVGARAIGIIHAYEPRRGGVTTRFAFFAAPEFTISYLLLFALFLVVGWWEKQRAH